MPAATTALANITLTSTASAVTFSSISSAYRDLILIVTGKQNAGANTLLFRFNNDSATNYSYVGATGYAGSSYANSGGVNAIYASSNTIAFDSTYQCTSISHFLDYSATDKHKAVLTRFGVQQTGTVMVAGRWINNSAISTLTVTLSANSFASGSTFALFGVSA